MLKKVSISVVIPTYNGLSLLKKNLQSVFDDLSNGDEVIIVDDASTDSTKRYLCKTFQLSIEAMGEDKRGEFEIFLGNFKDIGVKLIVNQKNLRFAQSCNRGVEEASNSLIFLINNDVALTNNVSLRLREQFISNPTLFAVGCHEKEPGLGGISGGKNKLWFERGLYHHSRADDYSSGSTAWASGGSAMFSREKWLELNGFDNNYYPAYWEDIDLSMRAKKKGWQVLFLESATVIHDHESTNKSAFEKDELQKISWKHADYFTWKHTALLQKLQYLMFRPYWWWKRLGATLNKRFIYGTIAVLLIASILRFYKLGQVPAGMTWDEAAIGYNGYAVVHTRHDEWLERLPISFKSFGDYKAPLAIYLVGIITSILGLNQFVLRVPFAISGVLGVWGLIKLTKILLKAHQQSNSRAELITDKTLALLSGLFLALTPWHIHFTRAGFESGLALTLIIWGFYYLAQFLYSQNKLNQKNNILNISKSVVLLASSMYAYHSSKIFVPLLGTLFLVVHFKYIKNKLLELSVGGSLFVVLMSPIIHDSVFGGGLTRGGTLAITKADSFFSALGMMVDGYLAHLSFSFLSGGWTDTLRHGTQRHSVLLEMVFALVVIGILKLIYDVFIKKKSLSWLKLSISWVMIGLLPAVLGDQQPQANRALLALPGFIWIALFGVQFLYERLLTLFKTKKWLTRVGVIMFLLLLFGNLTVYLHHYYTVFANESAEDFNEGYLELMSLAHQYERGVDGYPEVDQIIISSKYGQPYIYSLFVRKTNPIWYQGGSLIKYKFVDSILAGDLAQKNSLIVATKYDLPFDKKPDHEVLSQGGEIRFRVYYTGK